MLHKKKVVKIIRINIFVIIYLLIINAYNIFKLKITVVLKNTICRGHI